jgi:hypothetical protein
MSTSDEKLFRTTLEEISTIPTEYILRTFLTVIPLKGISKCSFCHGRGNDKKLFAYLCLQPLTKANGFSSADYGDTNDHFGQVGYYVDAGNHRGFGGGIRDTAFCPANKLRRFFHLLYLQEERKGRRI